MVRFFGSFVLECAIDVASVCLLDISGSGPVRSTLAGSRRRATLSDAVSVFFRFAG